jgi:hypothetical protein
MHAKQCTMSCWRMFFGDAAAARCTRSSRTCFSGGRAERKNSENRELRAAQRKYQVQELELAELVDTHHTQQ